MVQRTRLVIIFLLALTAGILSAQQSSFTPPALASEPILELPSDWEQDYSPAETTIIIEIKADSTATLFKILDDKAELKPLIERLLPTMQFIPAFVDENPIDANLTLKLNLVKRTQPSSQIKKADSDSLKQVDKTVLNRWINRQRQIQNLQQIFSSDTQAGNMFAPQTFDTFYRTNFYMMGLNSKPYVIMKDGFIQPSRLYYNASAFQTLSNFRHVFTDGNLMSFGNDRYTLPAMCTDVYAGLGDYEFNFARVQVFKNHLLGIEDFYTEFGFLGQNGWWQEIIADQTSSRAFLSLPIGKTALSVNIEKYDQNIPSSSLLPGLQSDNLYQIGQKQSSFYLKWQLPWLTLGWQKEKEILSAPNILNRQELETESLLLSNELIRGSFNLGMHYQYNYLLKKPAVQSLYQYSNDNEHQGLITTIYKYSRFSNQNMLLLSERGIDKIDFACFYDWSQVFTSGFIYDFFNGSENTSSDDIYISSNLSHFPAAYAMRTFSGVLEYQIFVDLDIKLNAGSKIFLTNQFQSTLDSNVNSEVDKLFSEIKLIAQKDVFNLTAHLEQTLQWNQYGKELYELPELIGQIRFKLTRDMGHSNAVSAGINLTGHTDYRLADQQMTPIYGSMIADVWLGVNITDLFEFQLMMKNLGNNTLYGVSPHPRTILGTIHWFYLN